ncbi:MAG: FG-GAP-like repeat-containing protein [Opitutales bacterium]
MWALEVPWTDKASLPGVGGATAVVTADFNKDGLHDIGVFEGGRHNGGNQYLAWFKAPNWEQYDFAAQKLGSFAGSAAAEDFDGDGWIDIAVTEDNHSSGPAKLYVYKNPGSAAAAEGYWQRYQVWSIPSTQHQNDMAIDDLDGDGKMDIVVKSLGDQRLLVALQNDIDDWTVRTWDTNEKNNAEGLSTGDVDYDGVTDIILSGVFWASNPTDKWRTGTPTSHVIDPDFVGEEVKSEVGDIDGDGIDDIYMGSAERTFVFLAWYKAPTNPRDEPWIRTFIHNPYGKVHYSKLADIDLDGDLDLAIGRSFGEKGVYIYYNADPSGDGSVWNQVAVDATAGFYAGAAADMDLDGDIDLVGVRSYANGNPVDYYYNELSEIAVVAPAAPSGLSATALSATAIQLTWSDDATTEAAYTVQRFNGAAFTDLATLPLNTMEYTDAGLTEDTTHTYRVFATNFAGDSPFSNTDDATTLSDTTPPVLLTADGFASVPDTVTLTFSEPLDAVTATDPASYIHTGQTVTGATLGADATTVTLTVAPGLTTDATYTVGAPGVTDQANSANAVTNMVEYTAVFVLSVLGERVLLLVADPNLALAAEGTVNRDNVSLASRDNGDLQVWTIADSGEAGFYSLFSQASGRAAEVYAPSPGSGDSVALYDDNGLDWQKFAITHEGGGQFSIVGKYNQRPWTALGTSAGDDVVAADATGSTLQRWYILDPAAPTPKANSHPDASDDLATTSSGYPVSVSVLANDTDADPGDTLLVSEVTTPAHGSATHDGTIITYAPKPGFTGSDGLTYSVSDGNGGSDSATLTIEVSALTFAALVDNELPPGAPLTGLFEDYDGDGFLNWKEFAYGTELATGSGDSHYPKMEISGDNTVHITFTRAQGRAVVWHYRHGTHLPPSTPAVADIDFTQEVVDLDNGLESVRLIFSPLGSIGFFEVSPETP